jgi:hypothetical protein
MFLDLKNDINQKNSSFHRIPFINSNFTRYNIISLYVIL